MTNSKRFVATIASVAMLFTVCATNLNLADNSLLSVNEISVSAATSDKVNSNGFYYQIIDTATHTARCTGVADTSFPSIELRDFSLNGVTYTFTEIADSAFNGYANLASVTLPDTIQTIGNSAFEGCVSLSQINIPISVTSIGDNAFAYCSKLTAIDLFSNINLSNIGTGAFKKCAITSIKFPILNNSLTAINDETFFGCSALSNVIIPESSAITSIGSQAFDSCTSLKKITLDSNVSEVGSCAFYNTPAHIMYNSDIQTIGTRAFARTNILIGDASYSTITKWAEDNDIALNTTTPTDDFGGGATTLLGDMNGNGKLDISDLVQLAKTLLG